MRRLVWTRTGRHLHFSSFLPSRTLCGRRVEADAAAEWAVIGVFCSKCRDTVLHFYGLEEEWAS